jgi:hypothetical protein
MVCVSDAPANLKTGSLMDDSSETLSPKLICAKKKFRNHQRLTAKSMPAGVNHSGNAQLKAGRRRRSADEPFGNHVFSDR